MRDAKQVKIYFDHAIKILEKLNKQGRFEDDMVPIKTVIEVAQMIQAEKHHEEDAIRKL